MAKLVKVGRKSELAPGGCNEVETAEGVTVALFNVEGTIYALENTCAHMGGPLGQGALEGKTVTCPWHGWQYDVTTAKTTVPPNSGVKSFPVKLEGDDIYVDLG